MIEAIDCTDKTPPEITASALPYIYLSQPDCVGRLRAQLTSAHDQCNAIVNGAADLHRYVNGADSWSEIAEAARDYARIVLLLADEAEKHDRAGTKLFLYVPSTGSCGSDVCRWCHPKAGFELDRAGLSQLPPRGASTDRPERRGAAKRGKSAVRERLAGMGIIPRGLSDEEAAAYVGLSTTTFMRLVSKGRYPPPMRLDGSERKVWDRVALDRAIDGQSERSRAERLSDEIDAAIDAAEIAPPRKRNGRSSGTPR